MRLLNLFSVTMNAFLQLFVLNFQHPEVFIQETSILIADRESHFRFLNLRHRREVGVLQIPFSKLIELTTSFFEEFI